MSSNRIEGVEVEPSRVGTVVLGKARLRDRDEEEVWGYRDALDRIHERGATLPVTEATIRSQGWHDGRHDPWPYTNYGPCQ